MKKIVNESICFDKLFQTYTTKHNTHDVYEFKDGFSARFINNKNIWDTGVELTDNTSGKKKTFLLSNHLRDFKSLFEHPDLMKFVEYDIDYWLDCCREERAAA